MSLKVLSLTVPKQFDFDYPDEKKLRHALSDFGFNALCEIDGKKGKLVFSFKKGCPYNGASNPFCSWPIKTFYNDSHKDACGLGHDSLYAWGGEVQGLSRKLKAGECDDYIRGAMRCAGFSRCDAGIVDFAVRFFSHCLHFGKKRDKEGMHELCSVCWVEGE